MSIENDSDGIFFRFQFSFLPPANEVCEGYVVTLVCQSFYSVGVVVSQHALQVVSQHALQQVSGRGWGGGGG